MASVAISLGRNLALVAVSRQGEFHLGVVLQVHGTVLEGDLLELGGDASLHVFGDSLPSDSGLWIFDGDILYDRWRLRAAEVEPEESPEECREPEPQPPESRIGDHTWRRPLVGEVQALSAGRSVFPGVANES